MNEINPVKDPTLPAQEATPIAMPAQPPKVFGQKVSNFLSSVGKKGGTFGKVAGILLLTGAIGAGAYLVQQQQSLKTHAGSAVLSLVTTASNIKPGDTFETTVAIDTTSFKITAADLRVHYDVSKLEAIKIEPTGNFTPEVLVPGKIDATSGLATITLGIKFDETTAYTKSGVGILAKVTFKAKAVGATTVSFDPATAVAAIGSSADVAGTKTPLQITIVSTATAAPSAQPTVSAASTPSPTAAVTATRSPTPRPPSCLKAGAECRDSSDTRCCAPAVCRKPRGDTFNCTVLSQD